MSKKRKAVLSPQKKKQLSPSVIVGSIIALVAAGGILLYLASLPSLPSPAKMSYQELVQEANHLMDTKDFKGSIIYYQAALEKNPDANDVRTDLAASYHSLKKYADAERELKTVLAKDPKHSYAHFNLGIVYYTQGKNKSAVEEFQAYLKLEPKGPLAGQAKEILASLKNPADFSHLGLPQR